MSLSPFVEERMRVFVVKHNKRTSALLKELVEAGKFAPVTDRHYALSDAPDALRHQGEGHPKERSSSSYKTRSRAPRPKARHEPASTAGVVPRAGY
jgi:hypothetical protein